MAQYNGLTGAELKKLVVKKVEQVLEADTQFGLNVTFPAVYYQVEIKFEVYPRDNPEFVVKANGEHVEPGFKPGDHEGPMRIEFSGEGPNVGAMEPLQAMPRHLTGHLVPTGPAADEIRAEEGLPIPRKRQIRNVGTVDI